jgi:hypothetical protein
MTRVDELSRLTRGERRRLLQFVTSFAWADLEVSPREVAFVHGLVSRLQLSAEEALEVAGWLKTPPSADDVDPTEIPKQHRQLFLEVVRRMVESDGKASAEEREDLRLLEQLTR